MLAETTMTERRSTPNARRWERLAAATGIVFVVLQVSALAVLGSVPALDDPPAEIQEFFMDDGGRVLLVACLVALSALFFLWFLGSLRAFLSAAEGGQGRLSAVAFGAGLVTITLSVVAFVLPAGLAWEDTAAQADPGLVRTVWNLNTLTLVPIGATAGAFSLAVALVILRTRVLPRWLGWLNIVSTILGAISVFYLAADDSDTPLGPINLVGFLLGMTAILLLSILMVIRLGKTEPAT